jgi:hypothetical protein
MAWARGVESEAWWSEAAVVAVTVNGGQGEGILGPVTTAPCARARHSDIVAKGAVW